MVTPPAGHLDRATPQSRAASRNGVYLLWRCHLAIDASHAYAMLSSADTHQYASGLPGGSFLESASTVAECRNGSFRGSSTGFYSHGVICDRFRSCCHERRRSVAHGRHHVLFGGGRQPNGTIQSYEKTRKLNKIMRNILYPFRAMLGCRHGAT